MPVETGPYCQYCADGSSKLHSFDETVARMGQFMKLQTPGISDTESEEMTLSHMSAMPAWREYPALTARLKK
jgi:hypothetical protein